MGDEPLLKVLGNALAPLSSLGAMLGRTLAEFLSPSLSKKIKTDGKTTYIVLVWFLESVFASFG